MRPECGALPSFRGSVVWALGLYRVHKGEKGIPILGPMLRDHATTLRVSVFRFFFCVSGSLVLQLGSELGSVLGGARGLSALNPKP